MIPYFGAETVSLFGLISIKVWGTFVALGYGVATWVAWRRAQRFGLSPDHVLALAAWIFFAAMVGARLFHVFAYEPAFFLVHPWQALDPRAPGYAITGGFLAAALVFSAYVKRHRLDWLAYADTLAWGIPWGCGIGRIGCFLIHDHPGTLTHFALGIRYPDGQVRHDLGLYLSLVGFAAAGLFAWLGRKPRPPGFWIALFFMIEGLSRFFLDFLRVADARFLFLTPAQWVGLAFLSAGGVSLARLPRVKPVS